MTSPHIHSLPVRVYYEDTDAAGIVYYANYLKFAERARTEILRGLGIDQRPLMHEHGIGFVVRRVGVEYFVPARLDDLARLTITDHDAEVASMSFRAFADLIRLRVLQLARARKTSRCEIVTRSSLSSSKCRSGRSSIASTTPAAMR